MSRPIDPPVFHRPKLAKKLLAMVLRGPTSSSGLFVAAPRRTGKSTFLRGDFVPLIERQGLMPIYLDLWADKSLSPRDLLYQTLDAALGQHSSLLSRARRQIQSIGANAGGVGVNVSKSEPKRLSVADTIQSLVEKAGKPVILIVDEAQQAAGSPDGSNMLFELKAARDQMNMTEPVKGMFRVLMTGSDRHKLAALRNTKDQAFYGASMTEDFPLLGEDFILWFCTNEGQDVLTKDDVEDVHSAFRACGSRPEILREALKEVAFSFSKPGDKAAFLQAMQAQGKQEIEALAKQIKTLAPLQAAVLWALQKGNFSPFTQQTLETYRQFISAHYPESSTRISVTGIQHAIAALQTKGFLWRRDRGEYGLEDDRAVRQAMEKVFDSTATVKPPSADHPRG